jgi:hypothetical protein
MTPRVGWCHAEVDAEHVPRRRCAHADLDERREPVAGNGLARVTRHVDDGADDQPDAAVREHDIGRPEIRGHGSSRR